MSALVLASCAGPQREPARDMPPVSTERFNGVTIAELAQNDQVCRAAFSLSHLEGKLLDHSPLEGGCGISNGVQVERTSVSLNRKFQSSCKLAATFSVFEEKVLQPAAERHFGQTVAGISHWGTYACRNRNNRQAGSRSEHAQANAIDIAGFKLQDGQSITVRDDWNAGGSKEAFLREVHQGACQLFQGVIGPDGDRHHHDHFHFDMGRWRFCR